MVEPAFNGAGQVEGMELWRIENLAPVKIPEVTGKFYSGDSYILLKTTRKGSSMSWNIHFWLGAESSQDETGVAAYKSVELDDSLGGGPVQYREVQGSESDLFLTYFKKTGGIEYMDGGIDSGFHHVERDVYETRLLHLKGKRTVRVKSVPVSNASLNTGDVFILDTGLKIFIFNGPEANKYEKVKGLEVANNIRNDERGGRAALIYLDDDPDNEEFWAALGGKITVTNPGEDDAVVEAEPTAEKKMFKLDNGSFSEEITLNNGRLDRKALEPGNVYLVQSSKFFIWIGKTASASDKKEAMIAAIAKVKEAGLPSNTPILRLSEGVESSSFKAEFFLWEPPISFKQAGLGNGAKVEQISIDYAGLASRVAKEDKPVDDGSGKVEVFRVEDFKLEPVPPGTYGQFYGGDSYVIHYSYEKNGRPADIIYFWQGRTSSADEKGASALLTKEMDDKLGGRAPQIRVPQGKEPSHFRSLFKGSMIIHEGGRHSGFSNSTEEDTYDTDGVGLFHIKGTTDINTHAVQVEEKASSLNSADCFVLLNPTTAYAWNGKSSNEDEKAVSASIAKKLSEDYQGTGGRTVTIVEEGSEPEDFWSTLGGKTEYLEMPDSEDIPREPRLFWASTATGCFRVDEVDDFEQDDLIDDDVMILDTYTQVFIWIGSNATEEEKRESAAAAVKYIDAANDERSSAEVPIVTVQSGEEPLMFTNHFHGWDFALAEKNKFMDPYAAKMKEIEAAKQKEPETRRMSTLKHVDAPTETSTPPPAPAPASPYENVLRRTSLDGNGNSPAPPPSASSAPPPPQPSGERRPSKFAVPVSAAEQSKVMVQSKTEAPSATSNFSDPSTSPSLSYDELKGTFPATVDPTKKELYLSDDEFARLFGVSKDTFIAQPAWKRNQKKKDLGLF
jgi:hypothetical protein